jgi:TolB-like protein/DNA-binding winged helix-turn-helix (wHTH) protein
VGFECYRIGDLLLDAGTQEVTRDGTVLQVPRLSFKLLLSLARHAPNVVTTEQLEEEVWEGLVVDRGTVNKRVLLLRKALSGDAGEDPYVAVVRGTGYRLVVPVERIEPVPDELPQDTGPPQSKPGWYQRSANTVRTTTYWLLGIVAVLVLFKGFKDASVETGEPVAAQNPESAYQAPAPAYSPNSVAVMPFVDLSDNQTHTYLGEGIAEDVINLLAGMDGLDVVARTSSFAFGNTNATLSEIAARLRVGTVLEGSIQYSEDRIRVTAQLIDASTGFHIWSQAYDRDFDELFEVQDDIAFNIAQALKLTLDENAHPDSAKSMTADMEAFKLYLKGRDLLNDRIHLRTEGLHQALEYFNAAIALDPKFVRAHAGVATVNWLLTAYDSSLDKQSYYENAEASAKFALEINPDSVEALGALASVYASRGKLLQAADLYERIRELGRRESDIVFWESMLHIRLGYFEELIDTLTREYERDPLNEHVAWVLADALNYSGRPAQAIDILNDLRYFSFRDYYLALATIYTGDFETARRYLRDVRMRSGTLPARYADMLIDALENPASKEGVADEIVAASAAGELDKLVSFESLLIIDSPRAYDLGIDPRTDFRNVQIVAQVWENWAVNFRRDPRFKEWVRAMGYLDFWKKKGWPDRCRPTGVDDFECI